MNIELKSLQAELVPVADENDSGPGTFHAIISSEKRDRDGDQLWADEWETPLPDHIQIVGDHDNNHIMSTIGSGAPTFKDGKIHVEGAYADTDYAQNARKLVNGKHLRHLSVAYREKRGEKGAVSRELINASFVNVPSNTDAVVLESKSANLDGQGSAQAIHDMAHAMGAECFTLVEAGNMPEVQKHYEALAKLGYEVVLKKDGNTIEVKEFSQAPDGAPNADPQADQAEKDAAALEQLKASAMSMQTRHLIDEGELNHA